MVKSYIIHLERSKDRLPLVNSLRTRLPEAEVVCAVDGSLMTEGERSNLVRKIDDQKPYPFEMMPAEIGCFLSHRFAWQKVSSGEAPFGLICEDDCHLTGEFSTALDLAASTASEASLIRFPTTNREKIRRIIAQQNGISLFEPVQIGLTATMYLLGKGAARHLLELSQSFDRPVDTWLQMRWLTGIFSQTVWPSGVTSAASSHGGSTIQRPKGRLIPKLKREVARGRYRAWVARQSKAS